MQMNLVTGNKKEDLKRLRALSFTRRNAIAFDMYGERTGTKSTGYKEELEHTEYAEYPTVYNVQQIANIFKIVLERISIGGYELVSENGKVIEVATYPSSFEKIVNSQNRLEPHKIIEGKIVVYTSDSWFGEVMLDRELKVADAYDHNDPIDKPMVDEQKEELLQFNPALLECVNKYAERSADWKGCFKTIQNIDIGDDVGTMICCEWWQEALSMCNPTLLQEHVEIIANKGEKEHIRICDEINRKGVTQ